MTYRIVFSDVDGTLLTTEHKMLPGTKEGILALKEKGIPFVIVSGRGPSGIYPIFEEYGFSCPIISFSGTLILDENRQVVYETGFTKEYTRRLLKVLETFEPDLSWNIYSRERWIVKNIKDARVMEESAIIKAQPEEGSVDSLPDNAYIGKALCICEPEKILEIERKVKEAFPELSIMLSSERLIEIMPSGITKGTAIRELCRLWNIPIEETVAFGDHYNDVAMLETVGMPVLMGNAPEELQHRFTNITDDCDHEGIYKALVNSGMI